MDNAILRLMDSQDVKDRKRAIRRLIEDGSPEALKYLAILYKTDSDAEIRDLAVKAGRYIKKQQNVGSKWEGSGAKNVPEPEPAPEEHEDYVAVSGPKQELAKSYLDQAMDASIAHDQKRAIDLLRKAFKTNPNLRLDSYSMNMACDITGRDKDGTLALLGFGDGNGNDEADTGDEKAKRKNDEIGTGEVSWGEALTDLAIYYAVVSGTVIVGLLLIMQLVGKSVGDMRTAFQKMHDTLATAGYQPGSNATFDQMLGQAGAELARVGIPGSIMVGLIFGVLMLATTLLHYAGIHLTVKALMSSEGSFTNLIHKLNTWVTVMSVFTLILSLAFMYFVINMVAVRFNAMGALPADTIVRILQTENIYTGFKEYAPKQEAIISAAEESNPIYLLLNLILSPYALIGMSIGFLFDLSRHIGTAYSFTDGNAKQAVSGKGCFAALGGMIFAGVMIAILAFACQPLFASLLSSVASGLS